MNGFDFDMRVLQPWARDPAFYQRSGPSKATRPRTRGRRTTASSSCGHTAFPLSRSDERSWPRELRVDPPLLAQARGNLTGNARDLWMTGTGTMREQVDRPGRACGEDASAGAELRRCDRGRAAGDREFVAWLEAQAPSKTGPSGIGKENYSWNLRHVHLVPMTWDDEVDALQRELARAHASLRLEEQRNRGLPQLTAAIEPGGMYQRAPTRP